MSPPPGGMRPWMGTPTHPQATSLAHQPGVLSNQEQPAPPRPRKGPGRPSRKDNPKTNQPAKDDNPMESPSESLSPTRRTTSQTPTKSRPSPYGVPQRIPESHQEDDKPDSNQIAAERILRYLEDHEPAVPPEEGQRRRNQQDQQENEDDATEEDTRRQAARSAGPPHPPVRFSVDSPKVDWLRNLLPRQAFFTKVDLAEAYYHFTLSKATQRLTTFRLDNQYFCFTWLPFGLRPGPFVMHQLATAITRHLRSLGIWAWSHMDNFLLAHPDAAFLARVTRRFLQELQMCGIKVNPKDTQREPTQTITFLGFLLEGKDEMIGHTSPRKQDLARLLRKLQQPLPLKTVERFVGHLVFYFSLYRTHYHMLTPLFRLLHHPGNLPEDYVQTLHTVWKVLPHRIPWKIQSPTATIAADASSSELRVATRHGNLAIITDPARNIYLREPQALALAALVAPPGTVILCDNEAVVAAVTRGHCRALPWRLAMAISLLFAIKRLWTRWVPTHVNPADAPSRITRTQVPN
ncbi:hypothetical protein HPB47_000469 [Ixodes persulcatus]|uniref:Uncharacterized protein n=1 Tax=Ixodes persulcatus TaxID=34615 RepID=A0AC60PT05_IXOPE|nr:hypothetical protein HPB47_000469 [Ixodes persulcatus]